MAPRSKKRNARRLWLQVMAQVIRGTERVQTTWIEKESIVVREQIKDTGRGSDNCRLQRQNCRHCGRHEMAQPGAIVDGEFLALVHNRKHVVDNVKDALPMALADPRQLLIAQISYDDQMIVGDKREWPSAVDALALIICPILTHKIGQRA